MKTLTQNTLERAKTILQSGGVLVFPTDTAYGLGGDFENADVIKRILKIKGRTNTKFTLIAASLEQVEEFFPLVPEAKAIAVKHWPGPLSIAVNDQFSVRVPASEIARKLAAVAGKPLIATSANRSGEGEIYTLDEAQHALGEKNVDLWIDGGTLDKKPPSTIIKVNTEGVQVIRSGAIEL